MEPGMVPCRVFQRLGIRPTLHAAKEPLTTGVAFACARRTISVWYLLQEVARFIGGPRRGLSEYEDVRCLGVPRRGLNGVSRRGLSSEDGRGVDIERSLSEDQVQTTNEMDGANNDQMTTRV